MIDMIKMAVAQSKEMLATHEEHVEATLRIHRECWRLYESLERLDMVDRQVATVRIMELHELVMERVRDEQENTELILQHSNLTAAALDGLKQAMQGADD